MTNVLKKLTALSDPYVLFSKTVKYMLCNQYIFQLTRGTFKKSSC